MRALQRGFIIGATGALFAAGTLLVASHAQAEGSAQLSLSQALRSGTVLYAEITDPSQERVTWNGRGNLRVTAPDGSNLGNLGNGRTLTPAKGAGHYSFTLRSDQRVNQSWDLAVVKASSGDELPGRVYSYNWRFNAGSFAESRASSSSFYAIVPGGLPGTSAVVELKFDGLAGYVYDVNANRIGVNGPDGGQSVPESGASLTPEYALFLSPPDSATFNRERPSITDFNFNSAAAESVFQTPMAPCNELVPGDSLGRFSFTTNLAGSFHLQCDLNGDGTFSPSGSDDLLIVGTSVVGFNTVDWDGTYQGTPVSNGSYACRIAVNVGEFHYVGRDIETSYPGLRLFEVMGDRSRRPLDMIWNDAQVQGNAVSMPNGDFGLETSQGLNSGDYNDPAIPNVNSRAWGRFSSRSKGNLAYLDTYAILDTIASTAFTVDAIDGQADADGDGLSDYTESCQLGTDPNNADTDGDGISDGIAYGGGSSTGQNGGLESNGRLASALARRAIQRSYQSAPVLPELYLPLPGLDLSLAQLAPRQGPDGETRIESSPFDLAALTNAVGIYGADYPSADGRRNGSILLIATEGEVYEHSKAVCDRAKGSEVRRIHTTYTFSRELVAADIWNAVEGTRDQAIVFKLYAQEDGSYALHSHWLSDDYPAVAEGQSVINVQVWSPSAARTRALTDALLAQVGTPAGSSTAPESDDPEVDEFPEELDYSAPSLPSAFGLRGAIFGPEISLDLRRNSGSGPLSLRLISLRDDALSESVEEVALGDSTEVALSRFGILDTTVEVLDAGKVVDRLWLTDGAWAAYEDSLFGGETKTSSFSRAECALRESALKDGVPLSGCARIEASTDRFAGVARHLARPVARTAHSGIGLWVQSEVRTELCVHGSDGDADCIGLAETPDAQWVTFPFSDEAPSDISLVSLSHHGEGSFSVEAAGLSFYDTELPAPASDLVVEEATGCMTGTPADAMLGWLALLGLLLRRRRTRQDEA